MLHLKKCSKERLFYLISEFVSFDVIARKSLIFFRTKTLCKDEKQNSELPGSPTSLGVLWSFGGFLFVDFWGFLWWWWFVLRLCFH